jgi:MFS family permease
VLFTSALIENTAFGSIFPILAVYMEDDINVPIALIGVVFMAYTVSAIPSMILGGMWADKIGRRRVLLMSLGLMSITMLMYFFATGFYSILIIALADSFVGSLYMPAANAMIADVIESPKRPEAFSILRIAWNVGFVVGLMLGSAIVAGISIKALFVFGSVIVAAAFFLNLMFIPETKPSVTGDEITFRKVLEVRSDKKFLLLCSLSGVFWFFFSQWMTVLPLYATIDLFVKEYMLSWLFVVNGLIVIFLQVWVTSKAVKFSRSMILMSGTVVASIGFGLIFFATDFYLLVTCTAVISVGELIYMAIVSALIADMSPESKRGIYMGFSGFVQILGNGIGFLFGVWLYDILDSNSKEYVWLAFAAIGMASCVGYPILARMMGRALDRPGHVAAKAPALGSH